jgi:NhaA family Na+:H+ antiporter
MLNSVSATITGVLLAFAIPFSAGRRKSPNYFTRFFLHLPVAFFFISVFCARKYSNCYK